MTEEKSFDRSFWHEYFLAIMGFFYFAQGAAWAAIILIPVFMQNELGVSANRSLTIQTIMLLPWYIKIIFGIISDRFKIGKFGRRRPYILLAGLFGLVGWFVLPLYKSYHWSIIVVGILLAGSLAIADTVIDSLAVDVTIPERRSIMQGVSWGFRGAGAAVSGVLLGIVINDLGYTVAYFLTGSFVVVGCILSLFMKEPSNPPIVKGIHFWREFGKSTTWWITLFNIIGGMGLSIILVLTTFLNDELGIAVEGIGLSVTFFAIGQFVGSIMFGVLGQKLKLTAVFIVNAIFYVIFITSFLFINFYTMRTNFIYNLLALLGVINGGFNVLQMRVSMEYSVGNTAGTLYNWYNSMANIGQVALGVMLIRLVADFTGSLKFGMQIASIFILLTLAPGIPLIRRLFKKQNKKLE
jgi:MFS family permease